LRDGRKNKEESAEYVLVAGYWLLVLRNDADILQNNRNADLKKHIGQSVIR